MPYSNTDVIRLRKQGLFRLIDEVAGKWGGTGIRGYTIRQYAIDQADQCHDDLVRIKDAYDCFVELKEAVDNRWSR